MIDQARALVRHDLERDGVSIAIRRQGGGILDFTTRTEFSEDGATDSAAKPLYLRDEEARALYEALGRHFGGDAVSNVRLRSDYDAERRRVDKMIDALITGPKAIAVTYPTELSDE